MLGQDPVHSGQRISRVRGENEKEGALTGALGDFAAKQCKWENELRQRCTARKEKEREAGHIPRPKSEGTKRSPAGRNAKRQV